MNSYQSATVILLIFLWSLLLGGSLAWNYTNTERQIMEQAYAEARASINKDSTFRSWSTRHGGVYVPITKDQQSVPWLAHVPDRDITTTSGQQLTLLNPATMLRQMMDDYADEFGVRGRITGLKYLNPDNRPDRWETEQLMAFERGERKEIWAVADIDGMPHLRYLRVLFMEPGCDKCHGILGYKTGDMRGATGLNLPLGDYMKAIASAQKRLSLSHAAIWLMGLFGIGVGGYLARQRHEERSRREREQMEASEKIRLYAKAFEKSGEAIVICNRENAIITVNPAFTELTGYSLEEVRGKNPRILTSGKTPRATYQEMWKALSSEGYWQGELWERGKSGATYAKWTAISAIRDERGEVEFYIASYTDVSERLAAEQRIAHLAHHDILTDLYNRFSLENRLEQAMHTARREGQMVAVLFIDMDRFKTINDSLGHRVGDQMLIEVARRLMGCVRESDIVARIGGDEFIVVLTGLKERLAVVELAQEILDKLSEGYRIDSRELDSSPSIGITLFPDDGTTTSELLQNADSAMYQAKDMGRRNFQFFTESLHLAARERLDLEHDLRLALNASDFELYYQPQIEARGEVIYGVEALIRWNHPEHGFIPPDKFISVAEDCGIILELGEWVLEEACRQLAEWKSRGARLKMAVNLSARQLQSDAIVDHVRGTMAKYGIEAGELELEVTESSAMLDPDLAVKRLTALSRLGVSLAIDDFGTGYSSLAYLKRLPIQILKLDRTFVSEIETDNNDTEISAATIALAHNLGLRVVAEGVETNAQRLFLASRGCDYLQGYLYSRPLAPEALWLFVSEWPNGSSQAIC